MTLSDELRTELLTRWSEPHRRHHNVAHLYDVLAAAATLADDGPAFDRARLLTALSDGAMFHTARGRELWKDRARANVTAEIQSLTG
ncbi:hypothetical protein [Mycolicibacterium arenosum]|uniref:Metal-dependent phosphohydrolase n=1 Tax=Mycolicibacterium arenosum TaxID=2952157 RepID=A0ABT1LZL0_9MYCO|nr:hypothetical protein [Mycolicibacterium sp. CAU 1645]MCP9272343.1 hypothetical protein [Mycolicibacterium sp. CAU 1645]